MVERPSMDTLLDQLSWKCLTFRWGVDLLLPHRISVDFKEDKGPTIVLEGYGKMNAGTHGRKFLLVRSEIPLNPPAYSPRYSPRYFPTFSTEHFTHTHTPFRCQRFRSWKEVCLHVPCLRFGRHTDGLGQRPCHRVGREWRDSGVFGRTVHPSRPGEPEARGCGGLRDG